MINRNIAMLKQFKTYHIAFLILIVLTAMACSNARYLSDKESLYIGPDVKIVDTFTSAAEKKNFQAQLEEAVRPKPNSTILGIRLKLTLYNIAGAPKKETGFRNWLRNKIGEPPVLGSDVSINGNNKVLQNIMQNYGFFTTESTGFLDVKKKKSTAKFEITTGPRTHIRNVRFEQNDSSSLGRDVLSTQDKTLLKSGDPYSLQAAIDERLRIDYALKNQGYYYFSPDYLVVVADTGIGNNQTDLTVRVKYNEIPGNAYKQYRINTVSVYPNYRLSNKSRAGSNQSKDSAVTFSNRKREASSADTVKFDDFQVIDRNHTYRPYVFYQAMQFSPGEYYNRKDQNIALNRLVTLGAFKFVKNEFTPVKDTNVDLLNVDYLLTPYAKKSFNGEFGGFTQNDSRGGVRGTIGWKNKNLFRGAELLTIKLSGSFEAQYGGISQRPNEYTISLQSTLNIPRFIIPFVQVKPSGMYIPRTLINAGYEYSLRSGYYQIHSFNVGYGYNWKEDIRKDHKLFPINITLVQTDTIDATQSDNFNLTNLFYNGLIFGPTYEFTYNSQADGVKRKNNFYFDGLIDLSGNIVGIAQKASQENPQKIFGSSYAQYIKTQLDFRYYRTLTPKSSIAAHTILGFGYTYGNSNNLPNVKQFFSGGSSSLRGFPSRLVGPGTYNYRDAINEGKDPIIEALGDIKTEFSIEYRRKIYSIVEGALFADAGNIWYLRDQKDFPGGTFSKDFYKELAGDVGLGLRFDFYILLLRLDFAFHVRKPWYPEGQRWRFNDIRFGDPDWRRENLMFNLAIGYPF
jgi:outer membrane protein insertion porin family